MYVLYTKYIYIYIYIYETRVHMMNFMKCECHYIYASVKLICRSNLFWRLERFMMRWIKYICYDDYIITLATYV